MSTFRTSDRRSSIPRDDDPNPKEEPSQKGKPGFPAGESNPGPDEDFDLGPDWEEHFAPIVDCFVLPFWKGIGRVPDRQLHIPTNPLMDGRTISGLTETIMDLMDKRREYFQSRFPSSAVEFLNRLPQESMPLRYESLIRRFSGKTSHPHRLEAIREAGFARHVTVLRELLKLTIPVKPPRENSPAFVHEAHQVLCAALQAISDQVKADFSPRIHLFVLQEMLAAEHFHHVNPPLWEIFLDSILQYFPRNRKVIFAKLGCDISNYLEVIGRNPDVWLEIDSIPAVIRTPMRTMELLVLCEAR